MSSMELNMDLLASLSQTFDHAHNVVTGVRPEQMSNSTPCSEWDVRALLTHTVGVVDNIGRRVRDEDGVDPNAFPLDADVAAQFKAVADGTLAAWRAAGLDGDIDIGAGPMPRQAALTINLIDTTAHAWDIARATDQSEELPAELATLVLGLTQGFLTDDLRTFAGSDPAVAVGADATPTQRLVAFLGRKP
jgi:uncharacterized protein (TIGR03086 family)